MLKPTIVTAGQIFKKYFKNRILLFSALFLIIFSYRFYKDRTVDWNAISIMLSLYFICILFFGFNDYWFHERSLKKIIPELLNQSPLKEFLDKGFVLEDDDKLTGFINDFNIFLATTATSSGEKYLTILIPLELRDDMEKYFVKFDDIFKITFPESILYAQAIVKDYNKNYNFENLYTTITATTRLLKERNIHPIELIEE